MSATKTRAQYRLEQALLDNGSYIQLRLKGEHLSYLSKYFHTQTPGNALIEILEEHMDRQQFGG